MKFRPQACAEFPNDNPDLHDGAAWLCAWSRAQPRAVASAQGISRQLAGDSNFPGPLTTASAGDTGPGGTKRVLGPPGGSGTKSSVSPQHGTEPVSRRARRATPQAPDPSADATSDQPGEPAPPLEPPSFLSELAAELEGGLDAQLASMSTRPTEMAQLVGDSTTPAPPLSERLDARSEALFPGDSELKSDDAPSIEPLAPTSALAHTVASVALKPKESNLESKQPSTPMVDSQEDTTGIDPFILELQALVRPLSDAKGLADDLPESRTSPLFSNTRSLVPPPPEVPLSSPPSLKQLAEHLSQHATDDQQLESATNSREAALSATQAEAPQRSANAVSGRTRKNDSSGASNEEIAETDDLSSPDEQHEGDDASVALKDSSLDEAALPNQSESASADPGGDSEVGEADLVATPQHTSPLPFDEVGTDIPDQDELASPAAIDDDDKDDKDDKDDEIAELAELASFDDELAGHDVAVGEVRSMPPVTMKAAPLTEPSGPAPSTLPVPFKVPRPETLLSPLTNLSAAGEVQPIELDLTPTPPGLAGWETLTQTLSGFLLKRGATRAAAILPRLLSGERTNLTRLAAPVHAALISAAVAEERSGQLRSTRAFQQDIRHLQSGFNRGGADPDQGLQLLSTLVESLLASAAGHDAITKQLKKAGLDGLLKKAA